MVKLSVGLGQICVSSYNKVATVRTLVDRVLWRVNGWELKRHVAFWTRETDCFFVSLVKILKSFVIPHKGRWVCGTFNPEGHNWQASLVKNSFSDLPDTLLCQPQVMGCPSQICFLWQVVTLRIFYRSYIQKSYFTQNGGWGQLGKVSVCQLICFPLN